MEFSKTKIYNFEGSFRGMRNPKDSWHLSDSYFGLININDDEHDYQVAIEWAFAESPEAEVPNDKRVDAYDSWLLKNGILELNTDHQLANVAWIGPKDMKLAKMLCAAGPEHRKFLRQIFVSVDITAPIYIWKELDTYKVATVVNSTSTMHKLTAYPITNERFEMGDYDDSVIENDFINKNLIPFLEDLRQKYNGTHDKRYWKELVRWLPEGWLQTRTWTANYETLRSIYKQRASHKLSEWHQFCQWIKSLPYAADLILPYAQAA